MPIGRLLIANRGAIAIRIARTLADMQIHTVAVYAEGDASSLHVRQADQAVALSGRGVDAYLDEEQLIGAAKRLRCDAIHPGYGFLSENAGFARRCNEEGICFVGASAELLELLGDRAAARRIALEVGIPTVPVDAAYVDQLVPRGRHVDVQILADGEGRVGHAWERECTLRRPDQALLEIAPSPTLSADTRSVIIDGAVELAVAVGYRGLGAFEFRVDGDDSSTFRFVEIHPLIRAEHTVTEEITGLDLVRVQIELADGRSLTELGLDQPPPMQGFAIQARTRTGDDLDGGYPSSGDDALAGKLIASGESYESALRKLQRSLPE